MCYFFLFILYVYIQHFWFRFFLDALLTEPWSITSSRLIFTFNTQKQKLIKLCITYCEYSYMFTLMHVYNSINLLAYSYFHACRGRHFLWFWVVDLFVCLFVFLFFFPSSSNLYTSCYTSKTSWCWLKKIWGFKKMYIPFTCLLVFGLLSSAWRCFENSSFQQWRRRASGFLF